MKTWPTIEESYNKTKEGTHFTDSKNTDVQWVAKYMDTFYSFAKNCNGHIAEIGVNKIVSAWCWAKAAPKKITLCDTRLFERANSEENGRCLDSYVKLCNEQGTEVVLEEKDSLTMDLKDVDLLFIDGLHTYDQVSKELAKFSEHVKKYIIFHDTILYKKDVGKAANEFLKNNNDWGIAWAEDNHPGIMIIERLDNE